MQAYQLEMRDNFDGDTTVEIDAADLADAESQVPGEAREWAEEGYWGDDGAAVDVSWAIYDAAGDEVASGTCEVTVEPDHDALIRKAGGDPNCDHEWTREGEGGCAQNPGVWSTGGTTIITASHCRLCGLHRRVREVGAQHNPGEHDTVAYEQPENWCAECQREECEFETEDDGD